MCTKPILNTTAKVLSTGATGGTNLIAEKVLGKNSVVTKTLNTTGEWVTLGLGDSGGYGQDVKNSMMPKPPKMPEPPAPPSPAEVEGPEPLAPGATDVASLQARRRRKVKDMQRGLASTIATGPGGLMNAPSLSTPTAGGLKLKLGA